MAYRCALAALVLTTTECVTSATYEAFLRNELWNEDGGYFSLTEESLDIVRGGLAQHAVL